MHARVLTIDYAIKLVRSGEVFQVGAVRPPCLVCCERLNAAGVGTGYCVGWLVCVFGLHSFGNDVRRLKGSCGVKCDAEAARCFRLCAASACLCVACALKAAFMGRSCPTLVVNLLLI